MYSFPAIWIWKEIWGFLCSSCCFLPYSKKSKSSVLFLAGLPHPRAGRASCTLFINENANKHTCTDNLQTLTSLSKIPQETEIASRTALLPRGPDCSSGFSNTCVPEHEILQGSHLTHRSLLHQSTQGQFTHWPGTIMRSQSLLGCGPRPPVSMSSHSATWNKWFPWAAACSEAAPSPAPAIGQCAWTLHPSLRSPQTPNAEITPTWEYLHLDNMGDDVRGMQGSRVLANKDLRHLCWEGACPKIHLARGKLTVRKFA